MKKRKKIFIKLFIIILSLIIASYILKKNIIKWIIMTIVMFLYLFFPNSSEETLDLGKEYFYLKPYGVFFDIYAYGGNGIFRMESGSMTSMGIPVILPEIKKIAHDSQFIIVSQLFDRKEIHCLLKVFLNFDSLLYKNRKLSWSCKLKNPFYDSLLYKSSQKRYNGNISEMNSFIDSLMLSNSYFKQIKKNKYNYWIINKKKNYVYGPLSKKRYEKLKDSLHIQLKLKKP